MNEPNAYKRGFLPYALAALLIGLVGGFSAVLGPAFVADLGLGYHNTAWTTLAQAISTAALSPILGNLGDTFGRRRMLTLGLILFTLGNLLSAIAPSLPVMIAARFLVGVGTAAMAPGILAYIASSFPREKVAGGYSLYMLISSASVILGPVLGGKLIAGSGWRTMLWVCVGISAGVLALCALLPKGREPSGKKGSVPFDLAGSALVLLFFGLALCIPAFGQNLGWDSPAFLWAIPLGAVSLAALIFVERRAQAPVLRGGLFRRPGFLLSILILFLTQGLMQANMTSCIVFVNHTRPESTLVANCAISVMYLGMSLGAVLLGPLADRLSPGKLLPASLLLTALGSGWMLLFTESTGAMVLMASLGILGLGLGGNGTILMKIALAGLSPGEAGSGTGTYGLFRDLAAPFGVAVLVPLFTNTVSELERAGLPTRQGAVQAIHRLAVFELAGVAAAFCLALLLPVISGKEKPHET